MRKEGRPIVVQKKCLMSFFINEQNILEQA